MPNVIVRNGLPVVKDGLVLAGDIGDCGCCLNPCLCEGIPITLYIRESYRNANAAIDFPRQDFSWPLRTLTKDSSGIWQNDTDPTWDLQCVDPTPPDNAAQIEWTDTPGQLTGFGPDPNLSCGCSMMTRRVYTGRYLRWDSSEHTAHFETRPPLYLGATDLLYRPHLFSDTPCGENYGLRVGNPPQSVAEATSIIDDCTVIAPFLQSTVTQGGVSRVDHSLQSVLWFDSTVQRTVFAWGWSSGLPPSSIFPATFGSGGIHEQYYRLYLTYDPSDSGRHGRLEFLAYGTTTTLGRNNWYTFTENSWYDWNQYGVPQEITKSVANVGGEFGQPNAGGADPAEWTIRIEAGCP